MRWLIFLGFKGDRQKYMLGIGYGRQDFFLFLFSEYNIHIVIIIILIAINLCIIYVLIITMTSIIIKWLLSPSSALLLQSLLTFILSLPLYITVSFIS